MRKRVLVLDDDELIRLCIKRLIQAHSNNTVEVVTVDHSMEAFDKLHKETFSHLVVDLNLTAEKGDAFLKKYLKHNRNFDQLKVCLYSSAIKDARFEDLSRYPIKYITKPDIKSLLKFIGIEKKEKNTMGEVIYLDDYRQTKKRAA